MIFLKRIEAFGFKSFAEPTTLNYGYAMTGIVGPNGSGKSNITDAIMWALGEQSSKSLRGDSMEDIVFSGSSEHKALNMAEVTLVFDNSTRAFSSLEYNEVSITRKYFKLNKESEYYINGTRVRLKDIQDVALETGLTKSSLAIISQGSISSFVESSPEQRRRLFDEAAGVARYKKRKEEALRKLIRSQENLDRLNDIINEIERKLPSLKRQSSKALEYQKKWEELKNIEVSILVKDIQLYKKRILEIDEEKLNLKSKISSLDKNIVIKAEEFNNLNKKSFMNEKELASLNKEFTEIVDNIGKLKISKINLESKKSKLDIDEKEFRISELKNKSKEYEVKLNSEEQKLARLLNEKQDKKKLVDSLSKERFDFNNKLDLLRKEITKIEILLENINNKKNSLEGYFEGVKNVLENKKTLNGIIGTVQEIISIDQEHELAMSSILQNSVQNIVATTANDVKQAINFLKSNKAGYATFLPLDTLKPNLISGEKKFAIQNANGFLGFANELIKTNKKYQVVLDYLVGSFIVVDNYDNAVELAKLINYKFNIVTLDGERILPHGAIVGGSRKIKSTLTFDASKLTELEKSKLSLDHEENSIVKKIASINEKIELLREELTETQSSIGAAKKASEHYEKEISDVKEEYRILTGKELNSNVDLVQSIDEQIIEVVEKISQLESKKEEINQKINVIRSVKDKSVEKQNDLNLTIDEERKMLQRLKDNYSSLSTDRLLLFEKQSNLTERLGQNYNLTFESAIELEKVAILDEDETRKKINLLRSEIKSLGNINVDAIQEYEEENKRYQNYVEQTNDVQESIGSLKTAINDMDNQMTTQFKTIIKQVNDALPKTFATLFGGGTASIVYTTPNDILNSGIDIKISPPGKKISNLNLLSGGEKSMVALSVLFSILKVKPIPLVILDEVEAPLDIANVERFAKYIKTFTENTQFMIVTHRIGTMENCDILFGATMQQKGITKLVQIKLLEARKLSNSN